MKIEQELIKKDITNLLKGHFQVKESSLDFTIREMGLDSLDETNLIMILENKYKIEFPLEFPDKTIKEYTSYIFSKNKKEEIKNNEEYRRRNF